MFETIPHLILSFGSPIYLARILIAMVPRMLKHLRVQLLALFYVLFHHLKGVIVSLADVHEGVIVEACFFPLFVEDLVSRH